MFFCYFSFKHSKSEYEITKVAMKNIILVMKFNIAILVSKITIEVLCQYVIYLYKLFDWFCLQHWKVSIQTLCFNNFKLALIFLIIIICCSVCFPAKLKCIFLLENTYYHIKTWECLNKWLFSPSMCKSAFWL